MGWLCLYAAGVLAFAAVGHFIWWVGATALRGLFGAAGRDEPRPGRRPRPFSTCPACRADVAPGDAECPFCGLLLDGRTARDLARVRTAEAEIAALAESGNLDADTARAVAEQLERRGRVLQGLPADGPRPARVPPPRTPAFPRPTPAPVLAPEPPKPVEPPPAAPPTEPAVPAALPSGSRLIEPPPESPRRHGSVLAAFMEERNILWGELVGGLLIVGCSIALVVTLWNRLEAIPYFPFLLAAAVTLALFGAGQYTLHHWKLTATSRGLLLIALLLAPLNLLLLADPIARGDVSVPLDVGVKLAGVLVLAWVVRTGARDVLTSRTGWRWLAALAVVGAPATQLLPAAWFAGAPVAVGPWLALACFAPAVLAALRRPKPGSPGEPLAPPAAAALLQFVGLAAFGLLAAWGLHVAGFPTAVEGLRTLALPLALAAVPVIEAGLLVQRRVPLGGLRATGTGVALAGFVALTGALAAAWPDPPAVLLVAAAAGLFLTRIAFREALPWAHAGAIPALALAAVVGFHGIVGGWGSESLAVLMRSAASGAVLAGVALALAAVAEGLARIGSRQHAAAYALGGVGAGFAGLFLVSINGPEHPVTAALVHGACAAGLLAANVRWRLRVAAHGGLWLVLVGSLWALHAVVPGEMARWGFVVAAEALGFAGLALLLKGHGEGATALLRRAGRDVSIAAVVLTPFLAGYLRSAPNSEWDTGTLFALGLTGLALARLTGATVATYLGSAAAFLGFLHLCAFTWAVKPPTWAVLVGSLLHATAATLTAFALRRLERNFARPLRTTALLATGPAVLMLVFPPADLALQWAGCAAWLGLVWLTLALVWREPGTFPGFQVALAAAAVFLGVAWVESQEWRPETFLGYFQPLALHTYSVALGLLGMAWVAARRPLRANPTARDLWVSQTWSAERVVLAAAVVFQVVLAAVAILPELRAELTAPGAADVEPRAIPSAFGPGAWVALGVLAAAVLASFRLTGTDRDTDPHLVGLLLLFLAVPVLWAGSFAPEIASASALRWGLGAAFVVGTGLVAARVPLRATLTRAGFPLHPTRLTRPVLLGLLAAAAGGVVFLSVEVAELGLTGRKPSGPLTESAFAAMGAVASNLVPLALVVLGLGGTAARERSPGYAFAGGLVFTATLAAGYALGVVTAGGALDGPQQLRVWLLACGGAAVWAAAWLAAERRVGGGPLLLVQACLGLGLLAGGAFYPALRLVGRPADGLNPAWGVFGQLGWLAVALATGAAVWHALRNEPRLKYHALALSAVIVGVVVACAALPWDTDGRWLSFHWLAGAWAVGGVGLVVVTRKTGEPSLWLDGLAAALAIMAVRGGWADPWRPWVPAGLALTAATLVGTAAVFGRSRERVAVSGLLVNLAAVLLWLPSESQTTSGLLLANAAGLAVAAAAWTAVSLRDRESGWLDFTDLARGVALVLLGFGLAPTLAGDRLDSHWLTWGATAAVAVSMGAALWEPRAFIARGGLLAAGVAAVLLGASATTTLPVWNVWQTPAMLAGFAALTAGFAVTIARAPKPPLGLPERGDDWGWLLVAQGVVGSAVLCLAVRTGITAPDLAERLASPVSVLLLVLAAVSMLRVMPQRGDVLRFATLALGLLVFATAAWAVPDPGSAAPWLQRNAWLFVALATAGVLGSEFGPRFGENWRPAARALGGCAAALAIVVLVVNLLQQVPAYDRETRHTPLEPAAVFAMLTGVLALLVLAIRFALRPAADPLQLPERRRALYVYLAEVLVVLFFVHVRFNVPELFLAAAVRYWTFAVMGLAFVGIGLAELFERRRVNVLAVPLRRTGVLLPLIPLVAFWAKPPAALADFAAGQAPGLSPFLAYLEKLPQHFDTYAWLWFLAGGVYGLVALSRRSFGWALLAALATNAAVWSLLTHHEVPFAVHPQMWVIPLALIVLVSEHVNRRRLRPDLSNGLRYLGVTMIYVASAADMFIAGVGQSVWLPVILAVFCVAGVLAGIVTGVRAFIFLGVGFLLLDIFAMIWHAAVNLQQTWVWYASGLVLGVAILALFAVFEKRKKRHTEG